MENIDLSQKAGGHLVGGFGTGYFYSCFRRKTIEKVRKRDEED